MNKTRERIRLKDILFNEGIFRRIFFSIMLLTFGMILLIISWINHIDSRNRRSQIIRAEINRLEATDKTLTQVFDDVTGTMAQILWTSDVLDYSLRPYSQGEATQYAIVRLLRNAVNTNQVIKKAAYYSDMTGVVLQSTTDRIQNLESFEEAFVFSEEKSNNRVVYSPYSSNDDLSTVTRLITFGGRIFLVSDFDFGKYLAALMVELDITSLNSLIGNDITEDSQERIYIYDQKGEPVFSQALTYSPAGMTSPAFEEDVILIRSEDIPFSTFRRRLFCFYEGRKLPWQYTEPMQTNKLQISFVHTMVVCLPAIGLILLFSVFLSMYVIRNLYQPVNRLLEIASEGTPASEQEEKNEFRILENVYSEAVSRHQQMTQIMDSVAPDILENTLIKLFSGREISEERLSQMLRGIGEPIPLTGRFMIAACVIEEPDDRHVSDAERRLYYTSLQKIFREFSEKEYRLDALRMDRYTIALLLTFPETASVVQIRKAYLEIRRSLFSRAEVLPYRLWVEYGTIVSHLRDIGASWQECLERIQYSRNDNKQERASAEIDKEKNRVIDSQGDETTGMEYLSDSLPLDKFWCRDKCQSVISLLITGERSGAYLLLEKTLTEIDEAYANDLAAMRRTYMLFLDEMIERVITYPLTPEEQELVDEKNITDRITDSEDTEALHIFILDSCRQICHVIYTYNQKNRFKYVDQAKEYISNHYTESDLSLSDVSEHIGISSSYLSELFVESGGGRFSTYLASYRVEQARKLLLSESLPTKEISSRCGFNSVQNFNRVFKKYTGMTPGQYRQVDNH